MKITVKVIAKAKESLVEEISPNYLKIKTTFPALKGKANEAVVELFSKHFCVKKSAVYLISGEKSRVKIFEIKT